MKSRQFDPKRRRLLHASAISAAAAPFLGLLQACGGVARREDATWQHISQATAASSYGALAPVADLSTDLPLLQLPDGFSYRSFAWSGDLMSNGQMMPARHDGMGVISGRIVEGVQELILVRNHESGPSPVTIAAPAVYDTAAIPAGGKNNQLGGGTTTLYFRPDTLEWAGVEPSLGGTAINCAGGVTPWGTWLSCEETVADYTSLGGRKHGYVFEVAADPALTSGKPIVGMGRFRHEAVAVDPKSSIVYLTEDNRNKSGLFRYVPWDVSQKPRALEAGGRLQAAKVKGVENADLLVPRLGDEYELEWVDIPDPDADPVTLLEDMNSNLASGAFSQAWSRGALRMSRGEGIWYSGGKMYVVDTSAGRGISGAPGYGNGCLWTLNLTSMRMRADFVSRTAAEANNPDNLTVTPRGGILLCEDGDGIKDEYGPGNRLIGLTPAGTSFIFAKNNVLLTDSDIRSAGKNISAGDFRRKEFCGACFDPSGRILFVNIQTPGITFAIWGPWEKGYL